MNPKLRSIIRYITKNYPYPDDLTKTRITKLVYLIDWENIKKYKSQITDIKWVFYHYGPYVDDVLIEATDDDYINIEKTISNFGTVKYLVKLNSDIQNKELDYDLTDNEKAIINKVIKDTEDFSWNEFIEYVYNTEPIKKSKRYSNLDLKSFV